MNIRRLITILANYPPDAQVDIYDRRLNTTSPIAGAGNEPHEGADSDGRLFIVVKADATEDNPYRRGALEQLFDEVATRVTDDGTRHDQILEASGECEHGINLEDGCPACEGLKAETLNRMPIETKVRNAIQTHLDVLLTDASTFVHNELLQDWPDPDGIRSMANDRFWARLDDELRNTPVDIDEDVREYTSAWEIFIGLVFERAEAAVRVTRGYKETFKK